MYLYHLSNSSNLYCTSNPKFSLSCSSCVKHGGPSGCGWCLATESCQTRQNCMGDWVDPGGFCLHDAFFSCIILIVILIIILIIILLLFLILYLMDGCLRALHKMSRRRLQEKARDFDKKIILRHKESEIESCGCSESSYIYGNNLSIGGCLFVINWLVMNSYLI